jgi:26 proteasome complex subunit DSS1
MVKCILNLAYDDRPPERIKAKQWREDWEDEDINDDFVNQLRKELKG